MKSSSRYSSAVFGRIFSTCWTLWPHLRAASHTGTVIQQHSFPSAAALMQEISMYHPELGDASGGGGRSSYVSTACEEVRGQFSALERGDTVRATTTVAGLRSPPTPN